MGQSKPINCSPGQEDILRYIGEMARELADMADSANLGELSAVLRLVGVHAGQPRAGELAQASHAERAA